MKYHISAFFIYINAFYININRKRRLVFDNADNPNIK